jgi:hypothetical protein
MGLLSDFFAATPQELTDLDVQWGPMGAPPAPPSKAQGRFFGFGRKQPEPAPVEEPRVSLPTVQSKGLTGIEVGTLDEFLTGTPYEELDAGGLNDPVRENDARGEGPWVFRVRREMRDALVSLAAERKPEVVQQWAATEELQLSQRDDIEALSDLVSELQGLAKSAAASDRDLYLWVSL